MVHTPWGYLIPHITKNGNVFILTKQETIIVLGELAPLRALTPLDEPNEYKHFYNLIRGQDSLWLIADYRSHEISATVPDYSEALDVCYDILTGKKECSYTYSEGYTEVRI